MSGLKFMGKDPNGVAKGINIDTKGNLMVIPSLSQQIMIADRIPYGVSAYVGPALSEYPVDYWEYNGYTIINDILWQTDKETDLWLRIKVKVGSEWKEANYSIRDDFGLLKIQDPLEISKGSNTMWDILNYDNISTNKLFRFRLKNPIVAPEGIRIYFDNRNTSVAKVGIVLRGRTI